MNRIDRTSRRIAACSLVALLAVTSCGGGSDANDVDDTRPERDEPDASVATAPPVDTAVVEATTTVATTDPPVTDPPVTEPPVTDPPVTDPPITDSASEPFCAAAENFFVPGRALDFADINDPFTLRTVFESLNAAAPLVIELAPNDDDAALFVESKRLLDIATPGLEGAGYDLANAGAIVDGAAVGQALIDFGDLLGDMQGFLIDRCSSDRLDLDGTAQTYADDLALGVTPELPEVDLGEDLDIASDDGSITATVPATWSDVDGAPDGEVRRLAAAPDLEAFLLSYVVPGMIVVTGDSVTEDDWIERHQALLDASAGEGCTELSREDYDDGVYTGTEALLDCGDPATQTRIIGGRDSAGELFFLLAIVYPVGQTEIRDTIVESFLL